jgi:hypothetical protein
MDGAGMGESALRATIANTFDVLAWEMELAGARSIYLDSVIGRLISLVPEDRQAEFLESIHTVDLLSQQLTSLSAFTRRMSGDVPDVSAYVHTALEHITLGALADRMCVALGGVERNITTAMERATLTCSEAAGGGLRS